MEPLVVKLDPTLKAKLAAAAAADHRSVSGYVRHQLTRHIEASEAAR
jgi:predicted HicB family RNase H-like nuclease